MTLSGSPGARSFGVFAVSMAGHVVVFATLGLVPSPAEVLARHEMTFEVVEPPPNPEPPPPSPPPPPPEPEPEREPVHAKTIAPKAQPEPVAPPPPDAKPASDEVTDFTGETLTADGAGSWSTVVGSGGQIKGPIGRIKQGPSGPQPQQSSKVATPGPRVVALASLARRPSPPGGMDDLLLRGYPSRARLQGVPGKVVTKIRVLPNGHLGKIEVVQETPPGFGFGAACKDMLEHAPPWQPPLDHDGTPVASDITYTCGYEVRE